MEKKMSEKDSHTELESAFELFDLNKDGSIDIEDLR